MTKKINTNPLISFCIATYKRPDFLKSTIKSILKQTYKNIEIIVSDNDPRGSSEKVVKSFRSKKIIYNKNRENIGVVKNFNQAFLLSKGEFITFISDDDPLEKDMAETLINLYKKYPNYDSFYGACSLRTEQKNIANTYRLAIGKTPMINVTIKNGALTFLNTDDFLKKFFHHEILPYFWWSTGITKREVIIDVGMMPEYKSLFFTDFCFLCLIGTNGKMVVINKPLGSQTIHSSNSLRLKEDLSHLHLGIKGFYKMIAPFAKKNNSLGDFEKFISDWTISHLLSLVRLSNKSDLRMTQRYIFNFFQSLSRKNTFIKSKRYELYLRLFFPFPFNTFFFFFRYANIYSYKKLYKYITKLL